MHQKHVGALKKKLYDYQTDPFSTGPAKVLTSGAEIDEGIVEGPEGTRNWERSIQ